MLKSLFVANLPWATADASLRQEFEGRAVVVLRANVVLDRETGRSRGFGFVDCEVSGDAEFAELIERLQGMQIAGRELIIHEAKPKAPRPAGSRD